MKFTFKTEKPNGRYRSFGSNQNHIKLKGKKVGLITDKHPHRITLKVIKSDINEDGNPNCTWKWITLKGDFESIDDAKAFLNRNIDKITNKWELHSSVD